MKLCGKILCLILALTMCLGLCFSAFAAEGDGTGGAGGTTPTGTHAMEGPDTIGTVANNNGKITINNAYRGETYKIYQIFYLESYTNNNTNPPKPDEPTSPKDELGNVTGGNYVYKVNTAWETFVNQPEISGDSGYVSIATDTKVVTWRGDATKARAGEFATKALAYAKANGIQPIQTKVGPNVQQKKPDGTPLVDANGNPVYEPESPLEFTGLKLGYYLVDSSAGALCSLDTTNPTVTMQDKNSVPTNVKSVQEGSQWGSKNDAKIGDTVNFSSYVTISSGLDHLVFHDKMSNGLTFNTESVKVVYDATGAKAASRDTTLTKGTHFNVVTESLDDDCTFHITFTDAFFKMIETGDHNLTITYTAKLNERAEIGLGSDGNKNTSKVSYGDENHFTPDSDTYTRTWAIPVLKYTLTGENNTIETPLAGAIFKLSMVQTEPAAAIGLIDEGEQEVVIGKNADGTLQKARRQCYRVATPEELADKKTDSNPDGVVIIEEITTNSTGRFWIRGLDSGTYYLHEIKAPDGFNKLANALIVQINSEGGLKQNETGGVTSIRVLNGTGSELPSTGGIGTTIFYVVGGILAAAAVVLLVTKRRMNAAA